MEAELQPLDLALRLWPGGFLLRLRRLTTVLFYPVPGSAFQLPPRPGSFQLWFQLLAVPQLFWGQKDADPRHQDSYRREHNAPCSAQVDGQSHDDIA